MNDKKIPMELVRCFNIQTRGGKKYTIPEEVFLGILNDKKDITEIEDWKEIIKVIIFEWGQATIDKAVTNLQIQEGTGEEKGNIIQLGGGV